MPWTAGINAVSGLISEWVEDPDKKNEIMFKIKELENSLTMALITSKTSPKTDAFVKLMIATRDVIIPMLRPLGAAAMTGFGMYCHVKGIDIQDTTQVIMDGAFPAWGASRHVEKQKIAKQKQSDKEYWDSQES